MLSAYCVCKREPDRLDWLIDACTRMGHKAHYLEGRKTATIQVDLRYGGGSWLIWIEDIDELIWFAIKTGQLEFKDNPLLRRLLRGDDIMIVTVRFRRGGFRPLAPLLQSCMDDESDFVSLEDGFQPVYRRHELGRVGAAA